MDLIRCRGNEVTRRVALEQRHSDRADDFTDMISENDLKKLFR